MNDNNNLIDNKYSIEDLVKDSYNYLYNLLNSIKHCLLYVIHKHFKMINNKRYKIKTSE